MSELKDLIDAYVGRHGSSYRSISARMNMSHGTISAWFARGKATPPSADELRALAVEIQQPYRRILDATLTDWGYLPEEGPGHGAPPAQKSLEGVEVVEAQSLKAPRRKPATRRTSPSDKP